MKSRLCGVASAALVIVLSLPQTVFSNVTVTPATGGTNILADSAANSPTPSWTPLGPITITENAPGDFNAGTGKTLVLQAPSGFLFNTAQIPSVDFAPDANITALSVSSLTTNKLTLSISVTGTGSNDSVTIGLSTNLQVRPILGTPLPVARNIFRPTSGGGNAVIAGITNDSNGSAGTSFGALSEIPGTVTKLGFTTQPGQAAPGIVFGTQPVVQTQDQFGNNSTLGLAGNLVVNVALTSGAGALSGTTNQDAGTNAGNGFATYTDLAIDTAGTNDQLTASATNFVSGVSSNFNVRASQTINFPTPPSHFYGDSFALSATASSGLPVSFSVLSGSAVITNTTITIKGTGSITVRASQAGNSLYLPAPNVDDMFTNGPAALTITVNNTNRPYLAPNPAFTASYSGFQNGDTPASLAGTLSFSTLANASSLVGPYLVSCSGVSSTNYAITFVSGALNVTPVQWATNSGGNGHFYEAQLVANGITWSNAFAAAQARGGYLATLTTSAENDFAYSLASSNANFWVADGNGGDGPWIGAYKLPGPTSQTNWAWVTGEAFLYVNWGPNQPNNFGGRQNFIQLYSPNSSTGELWNDAGDDDLQFTHGYLVEYDTFTNKTGQTISFAALPDKATGDPPFALSATASSGLPVTYAVLSGPASIVGNTVTINGVGTVVIDASQPGNSNYFAAPDVTQSFNVNRTLWSTNAGGNGHLYEVSHVVSGITWSNAEALAENAGGYLASVTSSNENAFVLSLVSGNSNLWVINSGSGTAFGPWLGGIAGAGPSSPTNWTWVNGDPFVFQSWGPFWPDSIGDHIQMFSPTLPFSTGWSDLPDTSVAQSYIIEYNQDPSTRTNQTISFGPLSDHTYGDPPFYLLATNTSGLPIIYTVTYGSATISNGNSLNINSVGTVVVQASTAGNSNYFPATPVSAQFNVNPAQLSVTASNAARSYGNTNPFFTGLLSGVQYNDNITATYVSAATTNSPIGMYAIVPTLVDPGNRLPNYNVTITNGTLTVSPTGLSVIASNAMRPYGATNPVFTGLLSGLQNNDNITATYVSAAISNSHPGLYAIVPTLVDPGSLLSNYTVFSSNGVLTVTPAVLSVTASNASRTYGATNPIFTGLLTGVQNNENVTATYASAATTNSSIGTYSITPTLLDPGHFLTNYSVAVTNGVLTVIQASLSVTASNATRAFGATNPVFTGLIAGIQNGDNLTVTYSTTASNTSPAGAYPIIPALVDPNLVLSNYNVSITNGTLTVTPSAAFAIQSVSLSGGTNILITWASISNLTYRVQYKTDLGIANWTSLTPDVPATNTTASITDTNAADVQRFYRVLQLPQ